MKILNPQSSILNPQSSVFWFSWFYCSLFALLPEDELFGNCAPENSTEKKGIEAPERTFLNKKKQREVISKLLEDRNDQKSLKAALKKLNTKGKAAIPRDDHLEIVHELLEHIDEIATRVPLGYLEMLYEIHLETPISALVNSDNDEAFILLKDYLLEDDDIFSKVEETKINFRGISRNCFLDRTYKKIYLGKILTKSCK